MSPRRPPTARYVPPQTVSRIRPLVLALAIGLLAVALVLIGFGLGRGQTAPSAVDTRAGVTATSGSSASWATTSSSSKATSKASTDPASGLRWADLADLPREASETMRAIRAGAPYPYPNNDGVVYHNAEGVLPKQPDGYYHEFTVVTPGSSTRGARRIVAGGPAMGQQFGEWYYTADHYSSFQRIRP